MSQELKEPIIWQTFKDEIRTEAPNSSRLRSRKVDGSSKMLFRGQANSEWQLETTLERAGHSKMLLDVYIGKCASARKMLGNIVPSDIPFDSKPKWKFGNPEAPFPNYEYIGFLRHHGFPSPLLDWTESPFVAAFFAFRSISKDVKSVRIYGFQSDAGQGRSHFEGDTRLETLSPVATIHERHFSQQCWYTWCFREQSDKVSIRPHEEGFSASQYGDHVQDKVRWWDILASERDTVLGDLFQMNVTPFSLFRTVDTAAETAALKLFGSANS